MIDIFQGTGAPVTTNGFDAAAAEVGGDAAALWSVLAVETRGFGYLPDRRPKILFERHIFHSRTHGLYSAAHPDISNPTPGGYLGGADEYQRLKRAMVLDRRAALESASWGLGQVMGFNATAVGFASVEAMIESFKESEDEQLMGCARFIAAKSALLQAFKDKEWPRVAFFYNGKNYAANAYDRKLSDAYARYTTSSPPEVRERTAQACLAYVGFNPRGIDGKFGTGSRAALKLFQERYMPRPAGAAPPIGDLDPASYEALWTQAGFPLPAPP